MSEKTSAILPTVSAPPKRLANRFATIARCLVILTTLAVVAACYFAREIVAPLLVALLLSLLLSPFVTLIERMRVPRLLASAFSVVLIFALFGGALVALAQPAKDWVANAPNAIHSVSLRLKSWREPVREAQKASEDLALLTQNPNPSSRVVVKEQSGLLSGVLSSTPGALETIAGVILLLFFFLSSGDNVLRRLVEIAPTLTEKRVVVNIARDIQHEISRYLQTITLINFGLGCVTAVALALWQVPNAMLWGAMVCLLNFAPYVGAAISACVLAIVAFSTFDNLPHALAIPGTFLLLAFLEGQIVTPMVIGRRLALNPLVVFVWLLLWGWLWGIPGILLAGPLLACFRIVCQHIAVLRPIYVLIGEARFEDQVR